jgi:hypothetical protein
MFLCSNRALHTKPNKTAMMVLQNCKASLFYMTRKHELHRIVHLDL